MLHLNTHPCASAFCVPDVTLRLHFFKHWKWQKLETRLVYCSSHLSCIVLSDLFSGCNHDELANEESYVATHTYSSRLAAVKTDCSNLYKPPTRIAIAKTNSRNPFKLPTSFCCSENRPRKPLQASNNFGYGFHASPATSEPRLGKLGPNYKGYQLLSPQSDSSGK